MTTSIDSQNSYLIIAHGGNCNDGFMAAFLMKGYISGRFPNSPCEVAFTNYGKTMPDVTGKTVFIVDFSYPKEILDEARKKAVHITMLDHHESAAKMWGGYQKFELEPSNDMCGLSVNLREDQSGAMLALNYVIEASPDLNTWKCARLLDIVKRIDDRDRWVFSYPDTNAYTEVLASVPQTFEAWSDLIFFEPNACFQERLTKAIIQCEKQELTCQRIAEKAFLIEFAGYTIPCVNTGKDFASRVGEILCEAKVRDEEKKAYPFSMSFVVTESEVLCSLRSRNPSGENVEEVAKRYGGGGHVHAAGLRLRHEQLPDLIAGRL